MTVFQPKLRAALRGYSQERLLKDVGAGLTVGVVALPLAMANVAGSLLGTRMALKHGAGFVRGVFLVVVSALIGKTSYDAFLR